MLIAIDLEFNELDILFALLHYPCKSKTWSKWDPMTIGGTPKFVDFTSVIVHPPRDIVIIWNIYCKLDKHWNLNDIMIFQYKFWTQDHLRKIIKIPLLSLIFDQLNFAFSFKRSMFFPSSILSILLEILEENFNLVIHFEYFVANFPTSSSILSSVPLFGECFRDHLNKYCRHDMFLYHEVTYNYIIPPL